MMFAFCFIQVGGDVFVWGTGNFGALGMGEDITERYRPARLQLDVKVGRPLRDRHGGLVHSVVVVVR